MKYIAVLGRQPEISVAELEALYGEVRQVSECLAGFDYKESIDISRLGL